MSVRLLSGISLATIATLIAGPAHAQDPSAGEQNRPLDAIDGDDASEGPISISGNVALTSDYRFRGVSFSAGDVAIQGGIDVVHESGFYVGTWASSIEDSPTFGEVELDLYAGYAGELSEGVAFDAGLLYYAYPAKDDGPLAGPSDYFEPYASISGQLGPASVAVGVAYAWDQDAIGDTDNLYLYTDLEAGIPRTPITLTAHLGYTDGGLSVDDDDTSFDYSLGATATVLGGLSLGVAYVGVEDGGVPSILRDDFTDDTVVVTVGYSF